MRRYIDDLEGQQPWSDAEAWDDADLADAGEDAPWEDAPWEDAPWDDASWDGGSLSGVMREVMHEDYAGADDEAYDDALEAVLDGMSAAEGFSFANALRQIERGASQALSNPAVAQIARTALPAGAGALGTLIGGPAGTAIGSRLGTLAAGAVLPRAPARPAFAATGSATPAAGAAALPAPGSPATSSPATGSAAAAQGLVLTQQPDVLKALTALALGQYGARQVGGVPVASVMNMLSQVFGQAAADADELAYLDTDSAGTGFESEDLVDAEDSWPPDGRVSGRGLYTALMDFENEELAS